MFAIARFNYSKYRFFNRIYYRRKYGSFRYLFIKIELEKKTIVFDKPTYTGFTILELSKCWLYELIYEVIKPNFQNTCLSYVDTDSCIFETSQGYY